MKIAAGRADAFAARPDPAARAVLVYGPDSGLVRERAVTLVRSVVPDVSDPFRVAELTGAALKSDPARLADEAAALSLTGGRRAVRVRDAGEESVAALAAFLDDPRGDALVVVEAGELSGRSGLRKLFEASGHAAALACYGDDAEGVDRLIDRILGAEKVRLAPDAREFLAARLGSDRQVTRGELEKLALYAGPGGAVGVEDVAACLGDSGALSLEDVAFAAGEGDLPGLMRALDRAYAAGESPIRVLRTAMRHFQRLHLAAGLAAAGRPPQAAMAALRPPVIFRDQTRFAAQVRRWPLAWLAAALDRLDKAEIDCKSTGLPDRAIAARTLLELARAAPKR